jgi:serine/threonine-protein kinase
MLRRVSASHLGWLGRRRFLKTCEDAKRLQHPNLVTPLDAGRQGDAVYVALPRIPAVSTERLLDDCGRALTIELATFVGRETCRVLTYLEEARGAAFRATFVPGQVFVTDAGNVVLADMGAPRLRGQEADPATARFTAPEEEAGNGGDRRAAIFSLGVLLYELLAREPIDVQHKTTLRSIDTVRIDVPMGLAAAVMRALEIRPDDRHGSARDLEAALGDELDALAPGFGAADVAEWLARHLPEGADG